MPCKPMRRSHANTTSVAPPYTLPFSPQMVTGRMAARASGISSKRGAPCPDSSKPPMSKPAQNTGRGWPAVLAVSTSTRTSGSRFTASKCAIKAVRSAFSSRLRWAGRFRVMVATPPSVCKTGMDGGRAVGDMGQSKTKRVSEDTLIVGKRPCVQGWLMKSKLKPWLWPCPWRP